MQMNSEIPRVFADLYPEMDNARRVVDDAGLNSQRIPFSGPAFDMWMSIFHEAEKTGRVDALLQVALAEYPQNSDLTRLAAQARAEVGNGTAAGLYDQRGANVQVRSAATKGGQDNGANDSDDHAMGDQARDGHVTTEKPAAPSDTAPPDSDSRLIPALRNTLANLYPDEMDARRVVADAGMDGSRIAFSGKAINTWISILVEAARTNSINALLAIVRAEYPANRELAELMRLAADTEIGGQLSRVQTQLLRWARNSGLLGGAEAEPGRAEEQLAQSLRTTLADLYAESMDARRVAADAGMDLRNLTFTGPMIEIWYNLLGEAARTDRLADLLAMAADDYPNNAVLQQAAGLAVPTADSGDPPSLQQELQRWGRAADPTATNPVVTPSPTQEAQGSYISIDKAFFGASAPPETRDVNDAEPATVPDAHAVALAGLALRLAEQGAVEQALAMARTIADDAIRARALTDLLPHLMPEARLRVMREAQALAYSLDAPAARTEALVTLTRVLGGLSETDQALIIAHSIEEPAARVQALADLARNLSANEQTRVVEETIDVLETITEGSAHVAVLANLAPYLSRDLLDRALAAAGKLADDRARALALGVLAAQIYDSNKKSKMRQEALATAQNIEESAERAGTLTDLIPHLDDGDKVTNRTKAIEEALSATQSITDVATRVNALLDLADVLPAPERRNIVSEVRAQVTEIEEGQARAAAQARLALCLVEQGETGNALSIVRGIEDVAIRAEAQASLAFHLVERNQSALAISTARGIAAAETRTRTLTALVPRLAAQGALDEARGVTRDIADDDYQAQAFAELVYYLPPEEQADVMREALALVGGESTGAAVPDQASAPNSTQDEQLLDEGRPAEVAVETAPENTATGNAAPAPDQGSAQPADAAPVDEADFVEETIPDGTELRPNAAFTKIWRLRNTGTSTWTPDYQLAFVDGDALDAPAGVNLAQAVAPGNELELRVNMVAPATAGNYRSVWRMCNRDGALFGTSVWVEIRVKQEADRATAVDEEAVDVSASAPSLLKDEQAGALYGSGTMSTTRSSGPVDDVAEDPAASAPEADGAVATDGQNGSDTEAVPQDQLSLVKLIKGIGAARNQWLRERLNITTADELAKASVDLIETALRTDKKTASRADIEWWIAQAQALVAGDPAPERAASPASDSSLLKDEPAANQPLAEQPAVLPATQPIAAQGAPLAFTVQLLQQATAAATGGNRAIFSINKDTVQLDLKRQDTDFGHFESNLVVDPVRMRALGNKPQPYGQALFDAIINEEHPQGLGSRHTAEGFQRIASDLAVDGCAIEYELDSNSDELHEYRWELLKPPDTDNVENPPPAVKARHPVYRFIRGLGGAINRQQQPGRIVILIANPKVLGDPVAGPELAALKPLDMAQELAVIEPVTRRLTTKGVADVVLLDGSPGRAATWQNLMDNLTSEVDILHIVAHGVFLETTATMFHLVLEHEGPEGYEFIDAAKLESGLKRAGRTPRLVILAACNSALAESGQWKGVLRGMGPRLVRNTPGLLAVIAMQKPLRMTDSRLFNHYFYDHLLRSGRVDVALAATRSRLYDENPTGDTWATPVLFMSTQDGQLFSAESTKEKLPQFDDYTPMPAGAASANSAAEATLLYHMQALAQAHNMPYLLPQLRPDAMPERPLLLRQDRARLDRLLPVALLAHELRNCIEIAPDDPACPPFKRDRGFPALKFEIDIYDQIAAALNTGKHIVLTGPPGTGKTTLAQLVCAYAESLGITPGNVLTTATTDWTTFDTIGGYVPTTRQTLQFRPGIFLEAIRQGQWLVIDEMNRAEIDKAVGEFFTVLAGQQVDLPYTVEEQPVRILPAQQWPSRVAVQDYDFIVHPAWRIIGTMNVYDKASLFQMSFAFMRRFAFIDVGLPPAETYADLCKQWWRQELDAVHQVAGDETSPFNRMVKQMAALVAGQFLMRHRALGPAIIRDIIRYVGNRARTSDNGFPENAFVEALMLFVTPQLDGLDSLHIQAIHAELDELYKESATVVRRRLLNRIELLYPHIDWKRE